MTKCKHNFQPIGKFYERKQWIFGGHQFIVFQYRQCTHCNKLERKMVLKKRVSTSVGRYEQQLRFCGIKPESQLN
jgi:hypothetical protein